MAMASRTKKRPTKAADEWAVQTGNHPKIGGFTANHARRVEDHQRQMVSLNERKARYEQQLEKTQAELEKVEMKLATASEPSWVEDIVRPIGEAIESLFLDVETEIMDAPGGVTIFIHKKGVDLAERLLGKGCRSLTLIPNDLSDPSKAIAARDYSKKLDTYPVGSPADLKGMNFAAHVITADSSVAELHQHLT